MTHNRIVKDHNNTLWTKVLYYNGFDILHKKPNKGWEYYFQVRGLTWKDKQFNTRGEI